MSIVGMVADYVRKQKEQQAARGRCCPRMIYELGVECDEHERLACPDVLVYRAESGYIGLRIHDGGTSTVQIAYCPWCGTRFPRVPA